VVAQTPFESNPGYLTNRDPCYASKRELARALHQVRKYAELAVTNAKRAPTLSAQLAALQELLSSAGGVYEFGSCLASQDQSQVPTGVVRFSRAVRATSTVDASGVGDALASQARVRHNYLIGQAKTWADRVTAAENAVRLCCKSYVTPPADTNPPPPNPGGNPPTGTGSGTGSGGTGGGASGPGAGAPGPASAGWGSQFVSISGEFPDFPPPAGTPAGGSTAGPGAPGPQVGFYGWTGYIEIGPNDLSGFNSQQLQRAMQGVDMLSRHCLDLEEYARSIELQPNSQTGTANAGNLDPQGAFAIQWYTKAAFITDLNLERCYLDAASGAGHVVDEINMKNRRGHSDTDQKLIEVLRQQATNLRKAADSARASYAKRPVGR